MNCNDNRSRVTAAFFAACAFVATLMAWSPGVSAGRAPDLTILSADGDTSLSFHLASQFRWDYAYIENGPGQDHSTANKLYLKRLRPVIAGSLFSSDLTYLLHLNLVPGSLELMDVWIDYRFHPAYRLRVGQMKVPFTRHRLNSYKHRRVVDWSVPVRYFGAERQWGLMLHNGRAEEVNFEYQLGLYTGVNTRAANGIGPQMIYAETLASPSDLANPDTSLFTEMHTEIVAHAAYHTQGMDITIPTDFEGGPARISAGVSVAWDLNPEAGNDMRLRLAPEAELKWEHFTATAVVYLGFFDYMIQPGDYELGTVGGLLQAGYLFLEKYELVLSYAHVSVLQSLSEDALLAADALAWAATDPDEMQALAERYASAGVVRREHEILIGFNWYIFDTLFKWQFDAGVNVHERVDGTRTDVRLRTQLQLSF